MNDKGTSNTITSVQKDNLVVEPQVLTPKRTEFGKAIRKKYESHEIEMSRHDMTTMEPRTDGVSNTLTSVQKDNYLAIPEATNKGYAEAHEGDSVNLAVPNSKTRRGRVGKQMANTLDTGCQQEVVVADPQVKYRIRKLTVREVFRLMGVDDADIDKLMNASISNSQLYKCAGNSIVVDVLYHIFRKLYIDKGCEQENFQQTLF
jgi:DNA (cytosine-5)-methyltransferase 1